MLLASRSEVLSAVIRIVMRVLLGCYRKRGLELGLREAETGAVSFVERFGGSLNCHTHLHIIVIDGVYTRQEGVTTRFHFVEPPSAAELASMVATICERVCRMLVRRGLMGEASHDSNEVRLPEAALDGCRTVALLYCTRPPLAMERLSVLRDGTVAYKLKWANKRSSHRVMSPLEFMARLAFSERNHESSPNSPASGPRPGPIGLANGPRPPA